MIGCIKAISPCVKSASAKLFLDLHTVLAPSGEERTLDTSAQVERAGRCCRRFDSGTQTQCGSATVMVLVSSARERLHSRSAILWAVPRRDPHDQNRYRLASSVWRRRARARRAATMAGRRRNGARGRSARVRTPAAPMRRRAGRDAWRGWLVHPFGSQELPEPSTLPVGDAMDYVSDNFGEMPMSSVRCSMEVLSVRLFCPWSVSGTG